MSDSVNAFIKQASTILSISNQDTTLENVFKVAEAKGVNLGGHRALVDLYLDSISSDWIEAGGNPFWVVGRKEVVNASKPAAGRNLKTKYRCSLSKANGLFWIDNGESLYKNGVSLDSNHKRHILRHARLIADQPKGNADQLIQILNFIEEMKESSYNSSSFRDEINEIGISIKMQLVDAHDLDDIFNASRKLNDSMWISVRDDVFEAICKRSPQMAKIFYNNFYVKEDPNLRARKYLINRTLHSSNKNIRPDLVESRFHAMGISNMWCDPDVQSFIENGFPANWTNKDVYFWLDYAVPGIFKELGCEDNISIAMVLPLKRNVNLHIDQGLKDRVEAAYDHYMLRCCEAKRPFHGWTYRNLTRENFGEILDASREVGRYSENAQRYMVESLGKYFFDRLLNEKPSDLVFLSHCFADAVSRATHQEKLILGSILSPAPKVTKERNRSPHLGATVLCITELAKEEAWDHDRCYEFGMTIGHWPTRKEFFLALDLPIKYFSRMRKNQSGDMLESKMGL